MIRKAGKAVVLNLHRVGSADGSAFPSLDPTLLEELIRFLERHFAIVSLDRLDEPTSRAKVVLSFDDGYRDFIEVAAPILERRGICANMNVIPGCIESGLPPINVLAQDFIGKAPRELVERVDVPGFGALTGPNLPHRISAFLKNRPYRDQKCLADYLVPQFFEWQEFRPIPMMTRRELTQIATRHDVGAHSFDHASMQFETEDYFAADLQRCRRYFEEQLELPLRIYAFPNGACTKGQLELALASGLDHVLLVGEDFAGPGRVRTRFTFGAKSPSEARFRALGGLKRPR